jgi:cytoplasmic iron level regulating protein YaaA (DUF328/UPF0246 family)
MKIIIAPAKQMKYTTPINIYTTPMFLGKQKQLYKQLKVLDVNDLHDIMHISFKMANVVYQYYHQKENAYPALHYYSGTVYQQLKLATYQEKEQAYLQEYLRILSAYYGVLSPYDTIQQYRLDMKMKINDINLYAFWQTSIKKYFKEEDVIISLASKEFSDMVIHPNIIYIDFVEDKGGKLIRNAIYVKQARGKMLHQMIKQQVTSIEDIKQITFDHYVYNEQLSSKNNLVFYRTPERTYDRSS